MVTALPDGGWVVTWEAENIFAGAVVDPADIYLQRYDKDGGKTGPTAALVNNGQGGQDGKYQHFPAIATLADGGFVVTWVSDGTEIYFQRFAAGGGAAGPETQVTIAADPPPTNADGAPLPDLMPAVAGLADGTWVIAWVEGNDTHQQRFDAAGKVDAEIVIETPDAGDAYPNVAALADGGWIATWNFLANDIGVSQQRYDKDGKPVGEIGVVAAALVGLWGSAVTALKDGGWLVTWETGDGAATSGYTYIQRYRADGAKAGEPALVAVDGFSTYPVVAGLEGGGWVVAWSADGVMLDTHHRQYASSPPSLSLSGAAVSELAKNGTVVGTLPAAGPLDRIDFQLLDDAGGRFTTSGNQLVVRNGVALDYEQHRQHHVIVRAVDAAGHAVEQAFEIQIRNVSAERTAGTAGADTIVGGAGVDRLAGGGGNDILKGGANADTLAGGSGRDKLFGGPGKDTLTGGSGQDVFVFDTKPSNSAFDTVKDFVVKDNSIFLDNAVFTKLGKGTPEAPVKLAKKAFYLGTEAHDGNDRVIYDATSGALSYDSDGWGAAAPVKIATLPKKLKMTYADFFVI